jgi:hypothetical protein
MLNHQQKFAFFGEPICEERKGLLWTNESMKRHFQNAEFPDIINNTRGGPVLTRVANPIERMIADERGYVTVYVRFRPIRQRNIFEDNFPHILFDDYLNSVNGKMGFRVWFDPFENLLYSRCANLLDCFGNILLFLLKMHGEKIKKLKQTVKIDYLKVFKARLRKWFKKESSPTSSSSKLPNTIDLSTYLYSLHQNNLKASSKRMEHNVACNQTLENLFSLSENDIVLLKEMISWISTKAPPENMLYINGTERLLTEPCKPKSSKNNGLIDQDQDQDADQYQDQDPMSVRVPSYPSLPSPSPPPPPAFGMGMGMDRFTQRKKDDAKDLNIPPATNDMDPFRQRKKDGIEDLDINIPPAMNNMDMFGQRVKDDTFKPFQRREGISVRDDKNNLPPKPARPFDESSASNDDSFFTRPKGPNNVKDIDSDSDSETLEDNKKNIVKGGGGRRTSSKTNSNTKNIRKSASTLSKNLSKTHLSKKKRKI